MSEAEESRVSPDSGNDEDSLSSLDELASRVKEKQKERDPQPKRSTRKGTRTKSEDKASKPRNTKRPGTGRFSDMTEDLTGMIASFAMPLMALSVRDPKFAYDAQIIMQNAEAIAKELNAMAERSPAVHRALYAMMQGTNSVGLMVALANVGVPIAANHGFIRPEFATTFGAPLPPWVGQQRQQESQSMNGNDPLRSRPGNFTAETISNDE